MPGVAAIILAAGASTRMGRPKQLLELEREPLVRRAARTAAGAGCAPVVVVLGAAADLIRPALAGLPDVHVTENPDWARGIGSSVRAGAAAVLALGPTPPPAAVILLCDQPLITPDLLRRQIAAFTAAGRAFCACQSPGGALGPPVLVAGDRAADLLRLPDDRGAKALWADAPGQVLPFPCPEAAVDVDTPADWAALGSR